MACCLVGAKPLSEPSIVNSNLRNKLQWNFKQNSYIFIQENAFENVVWKMAAIFFSLNVLKYDMADWVKWESPTVYVQSRW